MSLIHFYVGRYALTKQEHVNDIFDVYCSGGGFIISRLVVEKVIALFNWTNPFLKIDDAYLGHLIGKLDTKPLQIFGFKLGNEACLYYQDLVLTHPVYDESCMMSLQNSTKDLN